MLLNIQPTWRNIHILTMSLSFPFCFPASWGLFRSYSSPHSASWSFELSGSSVCLYPFCDGKLTTSRTASSVAGQLLLGHALPQVGLNLPLVTLTLSWLCPHAADSSAASALEQPHRGVTRDPGGCCSAGPSTQPFPGFGLPISLGSVAVWGADCLFSLVRDTQH